MKILIVGAGNIAREYVKICQAMKLTPVVVGNGNKKIEEINETYKIETYSGGIENFTKDTSSFNYSVVATGTDKLSFVCRELVTRGIRNILLEKPGAMDLKDLIQLESWSAGKKTNILVAFNRRYFSSVLALKKILDIDPALSCHFDFTEWPDSLLKYRYPQYLYENLLFGNSSHVIDTVFYLIGKPKELNCLVDKKTHWSENPGVYVGHGKTDREVLFSYHANWLSAGRWSIEIMNSKGKYILRPLEKLQFCPRNSVQIEELSIDDKADKEFKPGFYSQFESFIKGDSFLPGLSDCASNGWIIEKIRNVS